MPLPRKHTNHAKRKEANFPKRKNIRHIVDWLVISSMLVTTVSLVEMKGNYLHTSLISLEEMPKPFDGLEFPLRHMPDWVNTSDSERKLSFQDFPAEKLTALPSYDPSVLKFPASSLEWGNSAHDAIRNTQITYPVLWSGTYNMDGIEGNGSHPAVDIKAPKGTPVYAIGNGKVEKVAFQNNGFGNHIVIKHLNFPSFEDQNRTEDYYSSYSHLNVIDVSEGDIVTRGQKIGEVGATGLATTDHLHFQIDKNSAPWHPYWPFTYKDTLAVNISFYDAINTGLGKENVAKYTVNPMKYVGMYVAGETNITIPVTTPVTAPITAPDEQTPTETPIIEPETIIDTPVTDEPVQEIRETNVSNFRFIHDAFMKTGNYAMVNIEALNAENVRVEKPSFGSLTVEMETAIGSLDTSTLTMNDFFDGKAAFAFTPEKTGQTRFTLVLDENKTFTSEPITVLDSFAETSKFAIEHDGSFEPGVPEEISIISLDAKGNRTPLYTLSGSATIRLVKGSGKFSPQELDRGDFQEGVAHVTFVADSTDPAIFEVRYLETKGISPKLEYSLFSDVSATHPSFTAIKFLRDKGIVKGYDDGTFQPNKKVSRAEALKMIFSATGEKTTDSEVSFQDVEKNDWFHNYVAAGVKLNIVKGYADGTFRPSAEVSRAEFLKILLTALKVDVDPVVSKKPYSDVPTSAWFAPYVNDAKKRNFIPFTGTFFQPNVKMNRADVAEMIYRAMTALSS